MMHWLFLLLLPFSLIAKEIVSIYAVDRESGKVAIDEQSNIGMTPASCMKVLTTGAALHVLGEKYCFITTLEYDGEIKENILHGNLYIRGGGDPCLGAKDWERQLQVWGQAIMEIGIKEVKGRVVSDATAWETALAAPGWSWDDLGNYYGAGASALSFHENCYILTLKPSEVGGTVALCSTFPPQFDLDLRNELVTGPIGSGDQACIYGSEFSSLRFVRGSIPAAVEQFTIKGAISNPSSYLEKLFTKTIQEMGIVVTGQALAERTRIPFHITKSPTVAEIVQETNQRSMNLYAEHLLKAMGKGSTNSGARAIKEFWQSAGIDLTDAQITDGSGLSRNNVLSAKQCVAILHKLENSPHFATFFRSLPEVNGMRVKSGSMSLVKGYVGYSDKFIFAFFIGQCPDGKKKKALTEACFEKLKALHSKKSNESTQEF
jgi:D-alanyl-D-alanine carboxypeptidase/D-alanyl-D-alanine-endopeptidase (penicillin-binding protein 4)